MAAHEVERSIVIDAPRECISQALIDHEAIPDWQSAVRTTTVRERDANGRGSEVEFVIDVKVKLIRYVQRYEYDLPSAISMRVVAGDLKTCDTTYVFESLDGDRTRVTQRTALDPGRFVPGPVKSLIAGRMLDDALSELKARAESAK